MFHIERQRLYMCFKLPPSHVPSSITIFQEVFVVKPIVLRIEVIILNFVHWGGSSFV